jgi:DNA-binding NarL/FixJ family response regulator
VVTSSAFETIPPAAHAIEGLTSEVASRYVAQLVGRAREHDPLDELTSREREVLGLMAEGLTDRGIAERLYVTPKTVETHIRHVFAKLGIPVTSAHNRRVHAVITYLRS